MSCFRNIRFVVTLVAVLTAFAYLAMMMLSLAAGAAPSEANTAPQGSFDWVTFGGGDELRNWDFTTNLAPQGEDDSDYVDWGMRFIFAGDGVNVSEVKNRIDGIGDDPAITPELDNGITFNYAWVHDGEEQPAGYSNWDSDRGIKDNPTCDWNWGHMRIYAPAVRRL